MKKLKFSYRIALFSKFAKRKHETMAEIINLRRFRKAEERKEQEKQAQANRQQHGRTKAEKKQQQQERDLAKRRIEGHKLEKRESTDESTKEQP